MMGPSKLPRELCLIENVFELFHADPSFTPRQVLNRRDLRFDKNSGVAAESHAEGATIRLLKLMSAI